MLEAHALEGIISLGLLACLIYGPWQWACTDAARQTIFDRRDQLFDLARQNRLNFSSEEYQMIREAFNRQIQFAHALNWIRLVLFSRSVSRNYSEKSSIIEVIDSITDQKTRKEVRDLVKDVEYTLILMIFVKSPLLVMFGIIILLPMICLEACKKLFLIPQIGFLRIAKDATKKGIIKPAERFRFPALLHEEAAAFNT